jgi:hypothetical protein
VLFDAGSDPKPGVTAAAEEEGARITLADAGGDRRVLKP